MFGSTDNTENETQGHSSRWDGPVQEVSHAATTEVNANSSFEEANKVLLRTDSTDKHSIGEEIEEGEVVEAPTPVNSYDQSYIQDLKVHMEQCEESLQRVKAFSYESKEKKKISELTVDAEKLLHLWGEALEKKGVLEDIIRECTDATKYVPITINILR